MSDDFTLSQELALVEDRYLAQAKDPAWFARQRAIRWQERADQLDRALQKKRTPSGTFAAVLDALKKEEP